MKLREGEFRKGEERRRRRRRGVKMRQEKRRNRSQYLDLAIHGGGSRGRLSQLE